MSHSKKQITALILLMANFPWLLDKSAQLIDLNNECSSEDELGLVLELLERFDYWENADISAGFEKMVENILNNWQLSPGCTIICPPKVDSSADSGPAVIQTLKTIFGKRRIRDIQLVVNLKKIKDYANERHFVILADEFAGTGRTIEGKLKLIRDIPAYKQKPPRIYVCLLAATKMARNLIEHQVDGYFAYKEYDRGISDYYQEPHLSRCIRLMEEIEDRFSPEVGHENLPKFGYGYTEVLMGWESNIPNSVFPIFWWPERKSDDLGSNISRLTLFNRFL